MPVLIDNHLKQYDIEKLQNSALHKGLICKYKMIPLELKQNTLYVGIAKPIDQYLVDNISFQVGFRIYPTIVPEDQLHSILDSFCRENQNHLERSLSNISLDENPPVLQDHALHDDEPLIQFVNDVIHHAIQQSASDIHIEPFEKNCRIRYRRDGILYEITHTPTSLAIRLVTRLKVMARLDIAERRLPQDGRFHFSSMDIRVNVCPTLFGEKVVLRILDKNKLMLDLHELGLSTSQKELFISKILQPHGLILVTGPTGSGKTATLYSALNHLNHSDKNISTVEDPVEIQLHGINQINIQPKIGLEFDTILQSLLRQDPDVLMVGEIRDRKTADIAIQAAHTGHLVFSTLHTRSAIETIQRLSSMGIHPAHLSSATILILAQRLVRKLCLECKIFDNTQSRYESHGCQHCLNGYQGRTGIYELLPFTDEVTQMILTKKNLFTIKQMIKQQGFQSLEDAAHEKIQQGITTLAEIKRVLHS